MGKRRTADELIKDLETRIAGIKLRAERKKARRDPAVSQALAAIKAIDRSLAAGPNGTMKGALQEARATLGACVAVGGIVVPESTVGATATRRGRKPKAVTT